MKAKMFTIQGDVGRIEDDLNRWLSKAPIIIVKDYQVGGCLVFLYTEDYSRNMHRLEGEEPRCSKCNRPMKVRAAQKTGDLFWGCTGFPECKGTQPLTDLDWEKLAGPGTRLPPNQKSPLHSPAGRGSGSVIGEDDIPF